MPCLRTCFDMRQVKWESKAPARWHGPPVRQHPRKGEDAMVKRSAAFVSSMAVVALIAAGCAVSSAPSQPLSSPPEPASNMIKSGSLYRAKTDAPICETHDELITAAYEYDGGHTPDVSGCTALAKGEEVKVLAPKATDDPNAVQVDAHGHIGWTKSYYLESTAQ